MPLKDPDNPRARLLQILILVVNYFFLIGVSITIGKTVDEYDDTAYKTAGLTDEIKAEKDRIRTKMLDETRIFLAATIVNVSLHLSTSFICVTLFITMLIMVAVVIEHRKTLIATVALCGLLCAVMLVCSILLFVAKERSTQIIKEMFRFGITNYEKKDTEPLIGRYWQVIDMVQDAGKCCGGGKAYAELDNYNVYTEKFKGNGLVGTSLVTEKECCAQKVPFSCCNIQGGTPSYNDYVSWVATGKDEKCGLDPDNIHQQGCDEKNFGKVVSSMDIVAALYLGVFIVLILITVALFFLIREIVDKKALVLPPVRELQKMGFGRDTIQVLAQNADDIKEPGGGGGGETTRTEATTGYGTQVSQTTQASQTQTDMTRTDMTRNADTRTTDMTRTGVTRTEYDSRTRTR